MKDEFWLVWKEYGGKPSVMHETEEAAFSEAERLANNEPDSSFNVIHCKRLGAFGVKKPQPTWIPAEGKEEGGEWQTELTNSYKKNCGQNNTGLSGFIDR